jgi:hypothetical protein
MDKQVASGGECEISKRIRDMMQVSTVLGDDADVAGDEGIEGEAAAFRTCCC